MIQWPESLYASNAPYELAKAMYEERQHFYQIDGVPWEGLSTHFRVEWIEKAKRWLANEQPQRITTGLGGRIIGGINWGETS
jgi:hypothetical protein